MKQALPMASLILVCFFASMSASEAASAQDSEGMVEAQLLLDVSSLGERDGAERLGPVQSGRLGANQRRSFTVRVPADRCVVVVAKGGPGVHNLDVALTTGRSTLARDTGTGETALVRWCNTERARSARVTITAFRGAGLFAAAAYSEEPAVAAEHAAELAGESALTRLSSLVERHGGGMRPVSAPRRESLSEGEQLDRDVSLSPGRCYRVLAAGEAGVLDLDLALIGPGGATLQSDASDDASPTLGVLGPLCPAVPGDYRVVLRLESGEGAFAWQVFGNSARASTTSAAVATYRVGGSGNGYVANQVRTAHGRHAEGRRALTDLLEGRLDTAAVAEHRFRVTAGQCYVLIAAAVPSARDLDLEVRDQFGNERGADRGNGAAPHVRVCPRAGGSYSARVLMFEGYGAYGLQIFVGAP